VFYFGLDSLRHISQYVNRGTSDTQLAMQKLAKKHTPIMVAAIALWPPWCPPPGTAAYNN
jgi:hypothetical protein